MRAATLIVLLLAGSVAAAVATASSTQSSPPPTPPAETAPAKGDPASQVNPAVPPTTRTHDCTTSGCHSKQVEFAFLHAPVAAGACDVCHRYDDETKHTFTLRREGAALCSFCHIGKVDTGGLHVHKPVEEGKCTGCHSPHGSTQRRLINAPTTSQMCLGCHASLLEGRPHVHSPIAKGDCLGCHKAHSSVLPKLMVAEGRELCLGCHSNVGHPGVASGASSAVSDSPRVLASGDHAVADASLPASAPPTAGATPPVADPRPTPAEAMTVHKPFEGECTQCHEQHASKEPSLLKQSVGELCTSCHEPIAKQIAGANVKHSAVSVDRACLNCHAPHTSIDSKLLRSVSTKLCLECHNKPIKKADGKMIESVAKMSAKGQQLHGPVKEGDCSSCHEVHGGAHRALLIKPYSETFYQPFDNDAYALCFSCHKRELATEQSTTTMTGFRNGDQNLHYVHVIAQGEAGRSCRVCHDTHSAINDRQVRETTKFGEWDIPLRFTKLETGGSCAAGCHQARTYDRIKAVPKPEPLGRPYAPAPAAPAK